MKTFSRRILKVLLWIIGIVALYALIMFILSAIPVNTDDSDPRKEISVYIKSNGVHTDIVVPLKSPLKDWSKVVRPENPDVSFDNGFVGFGWGDRDFYLNTPEWSDLKVSTAFHAVCYLGSSIMHTTFMHGITENEHCVRIDISSEEYKKLIAYIESGFRFDANGNPTMIQEAAYGSRDSFYEGTGKYSIVYTCNSWTNEGLKAASQKAALWTLTDTGILHHYR